MANALMPLMSGDKACTLIQLKISPMELGTHVEVTQIIYFILLYTLLQRPEGSTISKSWVVDSDLVGRRRLLLYGARIVGDPVFSQQVMTCSAYNL